jgi:hypothetical protein
MEMLMPRSRFRPLLPALALGVTLVFGVVLVQNAKLASGTREWTFSVVGAAVAEPAPLSISEVARMHDAARDGNTALAVTLSERLEAALANGGGGPDRPVLLAYLGSAIALQARDGSGAMQKIVLTNRALRYLDEARELAPRSFAVLQITSGVQARLPGLFGRREQAVQDMLALHQIFSADPRREFAPAMQATYANLARLAPGQGDWAAWATHAESLTKTR